MSLLAFSPSASVATAASTTQSNVAVGGYGHYMRIVNVGPGVIYVAFYEPSQTPPTILSPSGMVVLAGAIEVFSVASDTTRVALLGDASGASVNLTRGEGQ